MYMTPSFLGVSIVKEITRLTTNYSLFEFTEVVYQVLNVTVIWWEMYSCIQVCLPLHVYCSYGNMLIEGV